MKLDLDCDFKMRVTAALQPLILFTPSRAPLRLVNYAVPKLLPFSCVYYAPPVEHLAATVERRTALIRT